MITPAQRAEIRRLYYSEHWKLGTIATELGLHRETVRGAVEREPGAGRPALYRPSALDPYLPFIRDTLAQYPRLRATRIHEMVRLRGYPGSVNQLRRIVKRLRPEAGRTVYRRVVTLVGESAQVDRPGDDRAVVVVGPVPSSSSSYAASTGRASLPVELTPACAGRLLPAGAVPVVSSFLAFVRGTSGRSFDDYPFTCPRPWARAPRTGAIGPGPCRNLRSTAPRWPGSAARTVPALSLRGGPAGAPGTSAGTQEPHVSSERAVLMRRRRRCRPHRRLRPRAGARPSGPPWPSRPWVSVRRGPTTWRSWVHLEVTPRRKRRIQGARLPVLKTLDASSFEAQPAAALQVLAAGSSPRLPTSCAPAFLNPKTPAAFYVPGSLNCA